MHFIKTITLAGLALLPLSAAAQNATTSTTPVRAEWNVRDHIKEPEKVILQSHRGAGDLAEENTIQAFELGWSLHTIPESDVRTTTDGVIVAFHDKDFSRVVKDVPEDLKKKGVRDLTFAELQKLDVGAWKSDEFKGRKVNTMDEIFASMSGKPERHLYLDIKEVDFKQLAELVKKHKVEKQVILASPSHDKIVEWKGLVPDSDTLLWVGGKTGAEQKKKYEAARKRNFEGITQLQIHGNVEGDYDVNKTTRDTVNPFTVEDEYLIKAGNELREKGVLFQMLPWKANTEGVYWKLLDLGVMSFATDHPDVTIKAIKDYYNLDDAKASTEKKQDN